jgi:DNA polymerase-1
MADGLNKTYVLECEFVPCLGDMEYGGFRLDVPLWKSLIEENKVKAADTRVKMDEIARNFFPMDLFGNCQINYGSPKQVLELLHRLRVTIPERMADGSEREVPIPDTNENTLNKIGKPYPIVKLLTDLREYEKKISTYGQSFIDAIHPKTRLIHASYDQLGTATGRLASATDSPFNPLNIPRLKAYRNAFLARHEGEVVETDDYSGCELRIWAELSQDPGLLDAYARGEDIHCYAATKLFGTTVTKKNENKHLRTPAKGLNFGGH